MAKKKEQILKPGERICRERGWHDDEELIDPKSGGFTRCNTPTLEWAVRFEEMGEENAHLPPKLPK